MGGENPIATPPRISRLAAPQFRPFVVILSSTMKHCVLWTGLAVSCASLFAAETAGPALAQGPARLLRHPTYHQGKVAFSYLGDIWTATDTGADVRRLTDHKARDIYPRFSPDGTRLAFSSNRDGNYDVFVIPTAGGRPRQLTFHSADDTVVGWSPDGKQVLFSSSRNTGVFPGVATLFAVSVDGGMEKPLPTDWGITGNYSADGAKLAFTRHPSPTSRQHYRGAYAADLWVLTVAGNTFTRVADPDYKGNYFWPMYGPAGDIFVVTDRLPGEAEKGVKFGGPAVMKSVNNIWKISERGGKLVPVTHHTSGNLSCPSISADRKTIVYEEGFGLWKLDVASGRSTEIRLNITSDVKDNDVQLRTISGEADSFSLSPSGKRAAISTHGEIFSIATSRGEVQRVTETFWRETSPRWSPDGKYIAFLSDRSGREEIWIADERGGHLKQVTDADCEKAPITWAPDSKSMLWTGSDRKLRRVTLSDGATVEITASTIGPIGTPQFSPDGQWISYSKPDTLMRTHVYLQPVEGGEEQKVEGEDFLQSGGAKWTPDGRKLVLLGGVGTPGIATLGRTTMQLYSVALTHLTKDPDERDVDSEEQAEAANRRLNPPATTRTVARAEGASGEAAAPARPATASTPKVTVKIEWDGLERRIKKLTSVSGSVSAVVPSPDSKTYAFVASGADDGDGGATAPSVYTVADDGTRLTRISTPPVVTSNEPNDTPRNRTASSGGVGDPQWSRDGRNLYYMQRNGLYSATISTAPSGDTSPSPLSAAISAITSNRTAGSVAPSTTSTSRRVTFTLRFEVDEVAERRQVFEEAWRVMKHRFYDARMHGVDWEAARAKYQPLLAHIGDSDELHSVIMQMIGELNASHTGISGGDNARGGTAERVVTRFPGFDLLADDSGFYKVGHIYKKGPADHDYVRIAPGNFILAVNGKPLKTADNYWKFFNLASGRKLEFRVNSTPETAGAWTVSYEPLSATAQSALEYERWVDDRKKMVDKLSGGEIGYLHIKAMDAVSFRKFQRDLLDRLGRKALIIDQRFNGGGGIDQELLALLNQRVKYQSSRGRDSIEVPRPMQAFFGPMCVLQNERSASDAEMFPDGFRKLGLGKLVGVPTMGAVIGTGSYRLIDGSSIRTPGSGVFTASGENLENYGVQPDVWVDNTPADFLTGNDRQIEKAVEVLRAGMKSTEAQ
jgi:tricorn protease